MKLETYVCDACGKRCETSDGDKCLHEYSFLSRDFLLNGDVCDGCMNEITSITSDNRKVLAGALKTAMERRKEQNSENSNLCV